MNTHRSILGQAQGFTLLEVMLFLAISAGLVVIAIASLAPRLRNVRFTQSVRGLETAVAAEFSASTAGENNRPNNFVCEKVSLSPRISTGSATNPGASKDCVINGTLVVFKADQAVFYSIVSLREPVSTSSACTAISFATIRDCYRARIARGTVPPSTILSEPPEQRIKAYQNGVLAESSIQNDGNLLAFGSVQNPNGTDRYQFFHLNGAAAGTSQQALSSYNTSTAVANPTVCLALGGRSARLDFSVNSVKPQVNFEGCTI